jgi:hypothetical protein
MYQKQVFFGSGPRVRVVHLSHFRLRLDQLRELGPANALQFALDSTRSSVFHGNDAH